MWTGLESGLKETFWNIFRPEFLRSSLLWQLLNDFIINRLTGYWKPWVTCTCWSDNDRQPSPPPTDMQSSVQCPLNGRFGDNLIHLCKGRKVCMHFCGEQVSRWVWKGNWRDTICRIVCRDFLFPEKSKEEQIFSSKKIRPLWLDLLFVFYAIVWLLFNIAQRRREKKGCC